MKNLIALTLFCSLFCPALISEELMKPTSFSNDLYSVEILDGNYLPDIDKPSSFLNFNYGEGLHRPLRFLQQL